MINNIEHFTGKIREGDCLELMQKLPKGKIDLIYIDPPFGFKADEQFGMPKWKDTNYQSNYKLIDLFPIKIFEKSYLHWLYPRLALMRELLSETGSIYVHIDRHVGHYVKILLDEIFGKENFLNEIKWSYTKMGGATHKYNSNFDTIFLYKKTENYYFQYQTKEIYSIFYHRHKSKVVDNKLFYRELKDTNDSLIKSKIKQAEKNMEENYKMLI